MQQIASIAATLNDLLFYAPCILKKYTHMSYCFSFEAFQIVKLIQQMVSIAATSDGLLFYAPCILKKIIHKVRRLFLI